jgi:hypothetical protein
MLQKNNVLELGLAQILVLVPGYLLDELSVYAALLSGVVKTHIFHSCGKLQRSSVSVRTGRSGTRIILTLNPAFIISVNFLVGAGGSSLNALIKELCFSQSILF